MTGATAVVVVTGFGPCWRSTAPKRSTHDMT